MKDGWYSRPVFFVENVERAIAFYRDRLGFVEGQRYEEDGTVLLGEVTRGDCTLLLNCQQPDKIGRGRIFVSLAPGMIDDLRAEFEGRGTPMRNGWWGYHTMIIDDPDGNELYFPYPPSSERS